MLLAALVTAMADKKKVSEIEFPPLPELPNVQKKGFFSRIFSIGRRHERRKEQPEEPIVKCPKCSGDVVGHKSNGLFECYSCGNVWSDADLGKPAVTELNKTVVHNYLGYEKEKNKTTARDDLEDMPPSGWTAEMQAAEQPSMPLGETQTRHTLTTIKPQRTEGRKKGRKRVHPSRHLCHRLAGRRRMQPAEAPKPVKVEGGIAPTDKLPETQPLRQAAEPEHFHKIAAQPRFLKPELKPVKGAVKEAKTIKEPEARDELEREKLEIEEAIDEATRSEQLRVKEEEEVGSREHVDGMLESANELLKKGEVKAAEEALNSIRKSLRKLDKEEREELKYEIKLLEVELKLAGL